MPRRIAPLSVAGVRAALAVIGARRWPACSPRSAVASVRIARRVVTPADRVAPTRAILVARHRGADASRCRATADTRAARALQPLVHDGTAAYVQARLGARPRTPTTVKRKLLTVDFGDAASSRRTRPFSGWFYADARRARPAVHARAASAPRSVRARRGSFPAEATGDALGDPGARARHDPRPRRLRAVPVFHALGITSLSSPTATTARRRAARTAATPSARREWRDVDAAVRLRPAPRRDAHRADGLVDGRRHRAAGRRSTPRIATSSPASCSSRRSSTGASSRLPGAAAAAAAAGRAAGDRRARGRSGRRPSPGRRARSTFDRLDFVARAAELRHPILHPAQRRRRLRAVGRLARPRRRHGPDIVDASRSFDVARHTKLWNYDQERWSDEHPARGCRAPGHQRRARSAQVAEPGIVDEQPAEVERPARDRRSAEERRPRRLDRPGRRREAELVDDAGRRRTAPASDGPPSHTIAARPRSCSAATIAARRQSRSSPGDRHDLHAVRRRVGADRVGRDAGQTTSTRSGSAPRRARAGARRGRPTR